jgi:hypothetical protein
MLSPSPHNNMTTTINNRVMGVGLSFFGQQVDSTERATTTVQPSCHCTGKLALYQLAGNNLHRNALARCIIALCVATPSLSSTQMVVCCIMPVQRCTRSGT